MRRRWVALALFLVAATAEETKLLRVADTAFQDQLYDFAERQYVAFLEQFPKSDQVATVRRLLAQCQLGQGKWEAAVKTLQAGQAVIAPDDFASRFWSAEAMAFGGEFAAAERHYLAVLENDPAIDLPGAAGYGLTYVRFKQGRYTEAATALAALPEADLPQKLQRQAALLRSQILMVQEKYVEADLILQEFLDRNRESSWGYRALRWRAELAARQQDWERAGKRYQEVIQSFRDNPNQWVDGQLAAEAWMGLGWIAWQQKDYDGAIDPFSQALSLAKLPWLRRDAMVKLGEAYVRAGELAQGVARLKDFLSERRRDPLAEEVQLAIADLFYADKDYGAALAEYKELTARYPKSELSARASFQAGWCAARQNRLTDALTHFQQAFTSASQPDHPSANAELAAEALFKVADIQFQNDALADAVGSYQRLISSYPQSGQMERALFQLGHVYQRMENGEAAISVLNDLVEQFPKSSFAPQALFQVAQIQINAADEKAARQTFERAAKMFAETPWRDRASLGIGESYYREAKYSEAIAAFTKLIEEAPNSELGQQATKNRGWCYYAMGDSDKTLAEFTAFLEAYPKSPLAPSLQFWVGDHFARQKDYLKAQENYQAIHQNYPGTDMADAGLYFAARAAYARQDYKNAIELNETLLKNYPASTFRCTARFGQGDSFTEMNQFEDALLVFESLVGEFPDCDLACQAQGRRGDCFYTLKRYDKAIAAFREALTCAREAPPALKNQIQYKLGQSFEKAEKLEEALEFFTKVVYEAAAVPDPSLPPERFWLSKAGLAAGSIRERQEQWREAITVYERLSELCPDLKEMLEERIRRIRVEHFILF